MCSGDGVAVAHCHGIRLSLGSEPWLVGTSRQPLTPGCQKITNNSWPKSVPLMKKICKAYDKRFLKM